MFLAKTSQKKTNYQTGLLAESLCRLALRLKFYRIVLGEIDIIAARGDTVALIEVKARRSQREAVEAIHHRQRERLQRAANDFLARHSAFHRHNLRFDVMLVAPGSWPVHIKDAWRPERV
jgi:putative endonuclease